MKIQSLLSQIWHTAADETVDLPLPTEFNSDVPLIDSIATHHPEWEDTMNESRVFEEVLHDDEDSLQAKNSSELPIVNDSSIGVDVRFNELMGLGESRDIINSLYTFIQYLRDAPDRIEDLASGEVAFPIYTKSMVFMTGVNLRSAFFRYDDEENIDRLRITIDFDGIVIDDEIIVYKQGGLTHTRFVQYGEEGYGFMHSAFSALNSEGTTSYAGVICDDSRMINNGSVLISSAQYTDLIRKYGSRAVYPLQGDPTRSFWVIKGIISMYEEDNCYPID